MEQPAQICYLCGKLLCGKQDRDHVPPRQFFARSLRRSHDLQLLTLPTHPDCNEAYRLDEEYFIHSLAPLAVESFTGGVLTREVFSQYRVRRNVPLLHKVHAEFEPRPSGLLLPGGKVLKRFDGARIWRVLWKVVRGLFFYEYNRFLPEGTPRATKLISPHEPPPDEFSLLNESETKGRYPAVFDYKYTCLPGVEGAHYWAMLFWDRIIATVFFHDPQCPCPECREGHDSRDNSSAEL